MYPPDTNPVRMGLVPVERSLAIHAPSLETEDLPGMAVAQQDPRAVLPALFFGVVPQPAVVVSWSVDVAGRNALQKPL